MKIKDRKSNVSFSKVDVAEVFQWEGDYYLRIPYITENYETEYNAVNLRNGSLEYFSTQDEVVLCSNATLVFE